MKIQVLGPGCPKCKKLAENAEAALRELKEESGAKPGTKPTMRARSESTAEAELVKVIDIDEIVKFGVMMTPGLAIDGKLKSAGRILGVEEIKRLICEAGK